jgi:hypothetical protein
VSGGETEHGKLLTNIIKNVVSITDGHYLLSLKTLIGNKASAGPLVYCGCNFNFSNILTEVFRNLKKRIVTKVCYYSSHMLKLTGGSDCNNFQGTEAYRNLHLTKSI